MFCDLYPLHTEFHFLEVFLKLWIPCMIHISTSAASYIYTVKNFGLFQPVKGCLSCAHVRRSNDN